MFDGTASSGQPGLVRSVVAALAFAVPLTAAWIYALSDGVLGGATYALPLGLGFAALAVALLLCAALRHRWALLTLLIVVAVFLSINFRVREVGDTGLNPQNGIKILTWAALLGITVLNCRGFVALLADPVIALLGSFAAVALMSAAWSPVPTYTAACAIGLLAYLGFACLLAREFDEWAVLRVLIWGLAIFFCVTWVAAAVLPGFAWLPPYGDKLLPRLQGISGHPNILAQQVSAFLLLVVAARRRGYLGRRTGWALMGLGFATLLATDNRTALLAVLLAWALVELRSRRLLFATVLAATFLLGLALLANSLGMALDPGTLLGSASRTGDATEVLTLTGRTELWGFAWQKILQRPLFGYGFSAFEAVVSLEWFGAKDAAIEAHNLLLQSLFTVGLFGTVPLMGAFAVLIRRWITQPNALRDLLTLYVLISGVTEADIAYIPVLLTLLFLLGATLDIRGDVGRRMTISNQPAAGSLAEGLAR